MRPVSCCMLRRPQPHSHKDCGAACLARGVPLAIAADDGGLYFPADGNQQLKSLLNALCALRALSWKSTTRWS